MCSSTPLFGTLNKPAMVTTWNKSSAELPTSFIITTPNEHQDVSPTWSRALGGSLYSIDGSQIDYVVLYSEWFGRCHYRLHPTKRHPYKRFSMSVSTAGNQRRIRAPFTLVLSVIGIGFLPLLPMPRSCRNSGKVSQASLPYSCDSTRTTPKYT